MKSNKILFYMEFPPPIHGMTYINKIIFNNLKDNQDYKFYNLNLSSSLLEIGKINYNKIMKNINLIFGAWIYFFKVNPKQIYIPLSATKFGVIRDFLVLLPSIVLNKTRILHLHGFTYYKVYEKSKLFKVVFTLISKNSKIIVLCNKQERITQKIMNRKSFILFNALQTHIQFLPKQLTNKKLKLLYISNISKLKGILDLMKAIRNIDNVTLTIAGNIWQNKDEFFKLLEDLKQKVNYIGFANEEKKQELLKSHDIFCIPSQLEEGSPISIIEAMAYGLPIIGTNKGCIKEMIQNCGYVIENELDSNILNIALSDIKQNYKQYSTNARQNYEKFYIKEVFIKNLEQICAE